jgi:hypothetical protein
MAGKKPIVLINGTGKPINPHYCYKKPQSAANRAIVVAVEGKHKYVQIWDTNSGKELAYVSRTPYSVTLSVLNKR